MDAYYREELEDLENKIKENVEWLTTTEGDEVECIGVENLEKILNDFLDVKQYKLKLSQE